MKTTATFKIGVALLLIILFQSKAFAQAERDTLKVLFVGNSYTYFHNLAQMVSLISDSTKTKLITRKSTVGGANLSEHWLSERGLKTKEKIKKGDFDIVVLQNHSLETINEPERFVKYMNLFCDFIKKHKAQPLLYNTWAREHKPEMQTTIDSLYKKIADDNGALLVPVGKTWSLARSLNPSKKLYVSDGSHPSGLGTFITACIFVQTIVNDFPENLKTVYRTKDIDNETITVMRCTSEDVVFAKEVIRQMQ